MGAVDVGFGGDALGAEGEGVGDAVEDDFGGRGIEVVIAGIAAGLGDGEVRASEGIDVVVFEVAVEGEFEAGEDT